MYKTTAHTGTLAGIYPEREEERQRWYDRLETFLSSIVVPWIKPREGSYREIVQQINRSSISAKDMRDSELLHKSRELGKLLRKDGFRDEIVAEVFALVREAAVRTVGMKHFDVQLIGGLVLLKGMVAEMETGEGKTLTATLPACAAALAGIPVHIVTVNDYLAERDAHWMGPVYKALGLTVGIIKQGMDPASRRAAYLCDVTYCTNKEVAFDYLKDRIVMWDRPSRMRLQLERLYGPDSRANKLLMRGLSFAIVDEVDSVLIDEARTPLIISAEPRNSPEHKVYRQALNVASNLSPKEDYWLFENERAVEMTEQGRAKVENFDWADARKWTNTQQREELVRQGLSALYLFTRDKHYLVCEGKVQIIDEYTGRVMADRSWERGLHQLVELKENCEPTSRKETRARISYQRFFRRYRRLAGMTGTAREVARELWSIYRLRVVSIPTNRPLNRSRMPDRAYPTMNKKWKAVVETISEMHQCGRPVLIGTRSVAASEHLSGLLSGIGLAHQVLNARQDREEAQIVAQAGQPAQITVATNMAGRGTDIHLAEGIAALGGLHVIATERHDARRIDRQLFGRCGRQGDPGTYEVLVSLEDELVTVYINKGLQGVVAVLLRSPIPIGVQRICKPLFYLAQRSAERLHARMRRNLLKLDTQMEDVLAFSGRQE
jgi:preprotein translocase subunit SecA